MLHLQDIPLLNSSTLLGGHCDTLWTSKMSPLVHSALVHIVHDLSVNSERRFNSPMSSKYAKTFKRGLRLYKSSDSIPKKTLRSNSTSPDQVVDTECFDQLKIDSFTEEFYDRVFKYLDDEGLDIEEPLAAHKQRNVPVEASKRKENDEERPLTCLLYTSPSPRDQA
eukprot:TRINITY_DN11131_c0_g1_i1.p1 TRINITY_DN11131_c0_g1~~TRINITY_DN11131_c0_g1_i1.p1  ORF type:complete len:167 (-),score=27.49 TRINITY_DN11131_c0_g1_i1:106-606(-)